MAEQDGKPNSQARREVGLASELYDAALEGIAELLSLRQASNVAARELRSAWDDRVGSGRVADALRPPPLADVRDLAFDLAELNVKTFKDVTRLSRNYTDFVWRRLKDVERRGSGRTKRAAQRQALLRLVRSGDAFAAQFDVTNATERAADLVLPEVLAFRKADGGDALFAKPSFSGVERLAPGASCRLSIHVPAASVAGRSGRYLAESTVALSSGAALQLFLELESDDGAR